ncbi:SurA N-terminal domain-containing protein [Oricola sp.]|uniref:peptidylprolyl isomerase n=1 Tax=Oricola sp. TaxID=1979950 RepID=UPI003BA84185
MLDALRKSSRSWVAKALLLLLLVSFAVWGVSGQIFSGGPGEAVVTAGETSVSVLDYRLAYDRQVSVLSRQFGQRISREQARLFGIDQQILGQLAAGAVLDEQSRIMNLGLSKDRIAALIAEDPAFHGANGQFSRQNFSFVLRNVGMTEDEYIENRQAVAIRQQLVEAVADGLTAPATLLDAIAQHSGETRDVSYIALNDQAIEPVAQPEESALRTYFDANKSRYRAPEYRAIEFVRLAPEEILDEESVSEDDMRADYEANQDRYTSEETRTIEQLVFQQEADAVAAHERILGGQSFEDAVVETGRTLADASIGTVRKSDLPDPAVADAAFAVPNAGDISEVVEGAFGSIIVRVTAINSATVKSYDEVKDDIRRELALVEANDVLLDVHDAYEDARAGGQSLREASNAQKLQPLEIAAIDAQGLDTAGAAVSSIPEQAELVSAAFEAEQGVENPPINAGNSGFIWYEVTDVTPSRDRTFEEVRDRVAEDWIADETDNRVRALAEELLSRIGTGSAIPDIGESEGYAVLAKYGLQRNSDDPDFGRDGTAEVFDGGSDHNGLVKAPAANTYNVFQVTTVAQALGGVEALPSELRPTLESAMSDDLLDQLVAKLQMEYRVQVYQSAIDRALTLQ